MIVLNVKELCYLRGITKPFTTLRKAGISQQQAHRYLSGKKERIVLQHIEVLCKLLRCTPNDIFKWEPDKPEDDFPENPMQGIRKKQLPVLNDRLKNLSVSEIEKLLG